MIDGPQIRCTAVALPEVVACHTCDMLQRSIPLAAGGAALCSRCGSPLFRTGHLDRALALTCTALVVFVIASAFPIATIETQGRYNATSLPGAVGLLWDAEMHLLALLVFVTTLLVPFLELALLAAILGALQAGRPSRPIRLMLRIISGTRPWGMVEVFMLGVLVSLVKLAHLAHVVPGVALWSYAALMLLLAAVWSNIDGRELWAVANRGAAE
ncbi:MAG: paraquat-inducible protein A [Sulfuritalea sp.]|nr:paraquat-inducible protein A [Sulfuritalea sp.]